jgi:DMSO/TMAO reductase YedYZ molybdopterin-dependent catalytic subunit
MRLWLAALMLALALPALAQVSTRVRITGEVQRELTLGVDDLRLLASRRTLVQERGYGGLRLVDLLQEAERDGVPLRDGEGRVTLVSLGDGRPSMRHVKWLARIEVRRVPEP